MIVNSIEPTKSSRDKIFEEEFFPHADSLHNFAYHLSLNEEKAADLVQETFFKAYRFIDSYQTGTNSKAWLFKILKNAFINQYRKKVKAPDRVDFENVKTFVDSENSEQFGNMDVRQEVFQGMVGDEVARALNSLPVDFKAAILLCDIEGFTYEEIAKIVDIPIGTVRSRLHRARNMLKELLKDYALTLGFKEKR